MPKLSIVLNQALGASEECNEKGNRDTKCK
jgi:hypothetical protein